MLHLLEQSDEESVAARSRSGTTAGGGSTIFPAPALNPGKSEHNRGDECLVNGFDTPPANEVIGPSSQAVVSPLISDRIQRFLSDRARLIELSRSYGSPLNIVFPQQPPENLRAFEREYKNRFVQGRVLCSSKPNRSRAILSSLAVNGNWIDVSSEGALIAALSSGVSGPRIQATGPKTINYMALAIMHGCYLTIDNPAELSMLEQLSLHVRGHLPAKVLLRIRGIKVSHREPHSATTFGFTHVEVIEALALLATRKKETCLVGFHFHLHGATNADKRDTFEAAFGLIRRARQMGLQPSTINMGGGFKIPYAASREEWRAFDHHLKLAVRGETPSITWQNDGLGYRFDSRGISGAPIFTDHAPDLSGVAEFIDLLEMPCPGLDNQQLYRIAADAMIELWIEPGRALFDQSGITMGRVFSTSQSKGESPLIRVEMNQSNLASHHHRLLTQPIFIAAQPRTPSTQGMFLVGNLCLSKDLLQKNAVYPGFIPQHGDLVIFINTAPYLMDFVESEMLLQPIARKVAATCHHETWHLCLDEDFSAIRNIMEVGDL